MAWGQQWGPAQSQDEQAGDATHQDLKMPAKEVLIVENMM